MKSPFCLDAHCKNAVSINRKRSCSYFLKKLVSRFLFDPHDPLPRSGFPDRIPFLYDTRLFPLREKGIQTHNLGLCSNLLAFGHFADRDFQGAKESAGCVVLSWIHPFLRPRPSRVRHALSSVSTRSSLFEVRLDYKNTCLN
jgi:hypothetical protein